MAGEVPVSVIEISSKDAAPVNVLREPVESPVGGSKGKKDFNAQNMILPGDSTAPTSPAIIPSVSLDSRADAQPPPTSTTQESESDLCMPSEQPTLPSEQIPPVYERSNVASGQTNNMNVQAGVGLQQSSFSNHPAMAGGMAPMAGGMAPMAGGMAPMAGGMAPMAGGMAPMAGGMAPMAGGMAPMAGGLAPAAGSIAPVVGGMAPATGGMAPATGGMAPAAGGIAPVVGGMAPVVGGMAPAVGMSSAVANGEWLVACSLFKIVTILSPKPKTI